MTDTLHWTLQLFTGDPSAMPDEPAQVKKPATAKKYTERDLLRMESSIGKHLFGPIPPGRQREFFCLDRRTWIWYEQWQDPQTKEPKEQTTRYEVHANGIIKIQEDQPYRVLEGQELKNLELAVKLYHKRVMNEIYKPQPASVR